MTSGVPPVVSGFESAETFTNTVNVNSLLRRLLPTLGLLVFVGWVLFGALLNAAGLPVPWLFGLVLSAVVAAVVYSMKKKQLASNIPSVTLAISPTGMVQTERYLRTELPWDRVRGLGEADLMDPLNLAFGPIAGTLVALSTASMKRPQQALMGAGTITLSPDAPAMLRAQVRQNFEARESDPRTGQPEVGIHLSNYDQDWRQSRIGAWIRAYRPDVLA